MGKFVNVREKNENASAVNNTAEASALFDNQNENKTTGRFVKVGSKDNAPAKYGGALGKGEASGGGEAKLSSLIDDITPKAEAKSEAKRVSEEAISELMARQSELVREGKEMTDEYDSVSMKLLAAQRQNRSADLAESAAAREKTVADAQKFANEHPVLASVKSVGDTLIAPTAFVNQLIDAATHEEMDPNARYNTPIYERNAIRSTVGENIAKGINENEALNEALDKVAQSAYMVARGTSGGQFSAGTSKKPDIKLGGQWGEVGSGLYQTGMSMADFLTTTAVSGGNEALSLAIMGTGAAASEVSEAKDRGLDDGQAITLGVIAGAAEILTEKVSIEALFSADWEKDALKYFIKNVVSEGSEEGASDIINAIADVLIAKGKSKAAQEYQQYISQGMSGKDALISVISGGVEDTFRDMISGAISGGIMAGGSLAVNNILSGAERIASRRNDNSQLQNAAGTNIGNNGANEITAQERTEAPQSDFAPGEGNYTTERANEVQRAQGEAGEQNKTASEIETENKSMPADDSDDLQRRRARYEEQKRQIEELIDNFYKEHEVVSESEQASIDRAREGLAREEESILAEERLRDGLVSENYGKPENHIDNRTTKNVSSPKIKAFQFDHPELHRFFAAKAAELMSANGEFSDLSRGYKISGKQKRAYANLKTAYNRSFGNILDFLRETGITKPQLDTILNDIIENHGQENYAAAKKVEVFLDSLLSGDAEYQEAKASIAGADLDTPATSFEKFLDLNDLLLAEGSVTEEELYRQWKDATEGRARFDEDYNVVYDNPVSPEDSTGAAPRGFADSDYNRWVENADELHPTGEKAVRNPSLPTTNLQGRSTMKTAQTIMEAEATPDERIAELEKLLVDGDLAYDSVKNDTLAKTAERRIRREGWEAVYNDWLSAVKAGKVSNQLVATGAVLLNNIGNSDADARTYADFVRAYNALIHNAATGLQAARVLKTLTPEGRLYMLQKTVENINEELGEKGRAKVKRSSADNVPVELWAQRTGERLADSLIARGVSEEKARTFAALVEGDIKRAAQTRLETEKKKGGKRRSEADILRDMIENESFYREAWEAAKDTLSDEYESDAEILDDYADFLDASLNEAMTEVVTGEKGIEIDPALFEEYRNAETDEARNAVIDKILQNIADQKPVTFMQKWTALRYMNMLGNLKTQARNILGNATMWGMRSVKDAVGTALETAVSAVNPGFERSKSLTVGKAWMDAAKESISGIENELRGEARYSEGSRGYFERAITEKQRIFRAPILEGYRKLTSWATNAGDDIFIKHHYARALAGYLKANGVSVAEFREGSVDGGLLQRATDYAIREAQEATFHDSNAFSDWVSSAMRGGKTPKALRAIAEGVMPFRKTPANVLVRAYEYSPAGLIDAFTRAAKGNATTSEILNSLSRSLTGSGIMALGYALAKAGLLRGAGRDEEKELDRFMDYQDYSIVIPGVGSYTVDWLTPATMPLFMGAALSDVLDDEELTLKDTEGVIAQFAEPILETSMLSGIDDAISTVKYSDNSLLQLAATFALSYLMQGATNTALGQLERTAEENRMTTYTDPDSPLPDYIQRIIGKASAKTPGWDYNQREYLNELGETESGGSLLERAFENFISPGYFQKSREGEAMFDLVKSVYDETGKLAIPGEYPDKTKDGKPLTPGEQTRQQKTEGGAYTDYVGELLKDRNVDTADKSLLGDILEDIRSSASRKANKELRETRGEGYNMQETTFDKALRANREAGMAITDYYRHDAEIDGIAASYAGKNDKDGKKQAVMNYINAQRLSDSQRRVLWTMAGYKESTYPW